MMERFTRAEISSETSKVVQEVSLDGGESTRIGTESPKYVVAAPLRVCNYMMMSLAFNFKGRVINYFDFATSCVIGILCEMLLHIGLAARNTISDLQISFRMFLSTNFGVFEPSETTCAEAHSSEPRSREKYMQPETNEVSSSYCRNQQAQNGPRYSSAASMIIMLLLLSLKATLLIRADTALDLRDRIINRGEPCLRYDIGAKLFYMNCSTLNWKSQGYEASTFITLSANETFDGDISGHADDADNGRPMGRIIDLTDTGGFEGLFRINSSEVVTFADAALIRNVHVRNGEVAEKGGFIVQEEQKNFIIDSCSSTGDINQNNAGGICGQKCSFGKILNSHSTGNIIGGNAGGITGQRIGYNGLFNITRCYSTGSIEGPSAGGICGRNAGEMDGKVYIKESYSTGDLTGSRSGGIVGDAAGNDNGDVRVHECYSIGRIHASESGGIVGSFAAHQKGEVHIVDCYTQGNIDQEHAGGITGAKTGGCCGSTFFGDVYINNTYASGIIKYPASGGIFGSIYSSFPGHNIHIQYSVYNGNGEGKLVGNSYPRDNLDETGNSNDSDVIRGQLYHYEGIQRWDNESWAINGTSSFPILKFQLTSPTPSPTPKVSMSASITPTPRTTKTATSSTTQTPTPTMSETSAKTETATITSSPSPSNTRTMTSSPTSSRSGTTTPSSSSSSSSSKSPSPTQSKSPCALVIKRILPVQRPPRKVQRHLHGTKKNGNKRA